MPTPPPDLSRKIAKITKRLLDAARDARKPFMETRAEIAKYAYDKTFQFLYQDQDQELFFKAKIAKAAEFVEIMGAALYPGVPDAVVQSSEFADAHQRARHKVEERYVDYAWKRGDMQKHGTKLVYDALIGGRGVVWTGFNARKNIVQSVFDTVDNLLIDPDARTCEEINWVARKRTKPRWWLASQYPDAAEVVKRLEKTSDTHTGAKGGGEPVSELIEYHEMYLRVGIHNYASGVGQAPDEQELNLGTDQPLKLIVAGEEILDIGEWEIPFHQDDQWPVEWYDPLESSTSLWPAAPLETGLGHIKALNWIYTLYLSKMRVTTRTPLVVANYNGQGLKDDEILKILKGKDLDVIRLNVNGDLLKLSDLVQQFKFDTGVEEFERFVQIVGQAFEKATGLYDVLYTGTTPTQIRNAATADMIRNSSQSRVSNMQARAEEFMSRLARKTLFAARILHPPEDLAKLFGQQAGALWGTIAPPEVVQQEQMMREQTKQQMLMMPTMGPMGPMPPDPQQVDMQIGPPQLIDVEAWLNEADREVAAGSMRPISPQQQVENLNIALNQLAPSVATIPGGAEFVGALAEEFVRVNKYSAEMLDAAKKLRAQAAQVTANQVAMASMPPPPPGQGGDAEKGPKAGPAGGTPTI